MSLVALSLKQPWAELVVTERKKYETRSWRNLPPRRYIGGLVAIHASKSWDSGAPPELAVEAAAYSADRRLGGIIGVVRIVRAFRFTRDGWERLADEHRCPLDWWDPQKIGMELAEQERFAEMVPCRGMLGFFSLPEHTERLVRERMAAAHAIA